MDTILTRVPMLATLTSQQIVLSVVAVVAVGLLIQAVYNFFIDCKRQSLMKNIPMPPQRHPFSHVMDLLAGRPWDVMMGWLRKYGSVVRFHFLDTYIILGDPDLIRHVFQTNYENYLKDLKASYKPFLDILGTGLITSHGDLWRKQRGLVATAFRMEILGHAATISREAVDRLTARLEKWRGTGKPIEMAEEFRHMTLQVIGEAVLSMAPEVADEVFPKLYLPIAQEGNERTWYPWRRFLPTLTNWRYHQAVRKLNSYVTRFIQDRWAMRLQEQKNGPSKRMQDIFDRILDSVPVSSWNMQTVTQLRDEIKTFLFAGHETSSMMLTWTLYELTKNPRCMAKVKAEADAVFKNGAMPNFDDLRNLTYTFNALKEAVRLYSIVPVVTREVAETDRVGEYTFPKGARVVVHMKAVHHNELYWDNPTEFRPERFENKLVHPYAFIGFIEGPRNCIGQHFSLLESKIVLALLVQRFNFTPAAGNVGEMHKYEIPIGPVDKMTMLVN